MRADYAKVSAPVELLSTMSSIVARVTCDQCGSHSDWNLPTRPPPEVLPKHFKRAGWLLGKRTVCSHCAKAKEKNVPANVTPIKPDEPETAASDAAKKAKRLIYQALEDYYDDATKSYRQGHSDKSIADEVGTSEKFVATIRESDFGPLSEPNEFRAIRQEAAALASEIGKLQHKLDMMANRNGWKA